MHSLAAPDNGPLVPARADFDHSPLIAFYEIIRACELACLHCRANAQPQADSQELTPGQSCELIDQLAGFPKPPVLVLTGGDPLQRADLFRLVDHAVAAGLEVCVTPSATARVTRTALERLREAGVARLAISLDGSDAATHDGLRGVRGSYDRTWQIIRSAESLGIPLQINTTLSRHNFTQIAPLAEQLANAHIVLWSVLFLVPVARAQAMPRLTADECEQAFAALWRESRRRKYGIKTTEAPHYRRYVLQQLRRGDATGDNTGALSQYLSRAARMGINDGRGILFVSHVGSIYPSGFMPFVCGTFPRDSVVDVYQNAPLLRALRDADRLQGKCGVCEYRAICGGSRAQALAMSEDPLAAEPDCSYVSSAWQPLEAASGL